MRKLLLLTEIFPPQTGGSGRWFWEIYRRLPREKVVVVAQDYRGYEEFDKTHDLIIERTPLKMRSWGIARPRNFLKYLRTARVVRKLARRHAVKQIHCARCLPEGLLALAIRIRTGTPYFCYVHGEEISTASGSRELTILARRSLQGAQRVIANSENTKRMLCGHWGLPDAHVQVFYPGVDTDLFRPTPRDDHWRRNHGWDGRRVVLTVGRLQRRKGHDQLIRALPRIRQAVPEVLYAIVGDGDERARLEELVRELNVSDLVQFVGEVDDSEMIHYYQQCDLFALPNRQIGRDIEGFGIVLLEAQACGKPVVAGDSGGTAETMSIPATGRVVACDDCGPLGDLLAVLLADTETLERMGHAAREWVVSRFDWKVLSMQAEEIFSAQA